MSTLFPEINEKVVDKILEDMEKTYIPCSDSSDINIDVAISKFGSKAIFKLQEVFKVKPTFAQVKAYLDACPNCELRCAGQTSIEYGVKLTTQYIGIRQGEVITIHIPYYNIGDLNFDHLLGVLSMAWNVDKLILLGDMLDLWAEPQTY